MIDYDPHLWRDHLLDIHGSMVKQIGYRVAAAVLWSVLVVQLYEHAWHIAIPITLHSLVGFALGLLLVFRTNAAYDRFWEGRRMWGGIVNECRNLARLSRVLLGGASPIHADIVKWAVVFCYATMSQLRTKRSIGQSASLLTAGDLEEALAAQHIPLHAAVRMSAAINAAKQRGIISDIQQVTLDQNVQLLIDYLGACERIHKTPLPFAYVVHLRRALIAYCFTLPFALLDPFHWLTVPATFIVTYIFFGIEEIGVQIEDPFGVDDNDLPLERFCESIERSVLALVEGAGPQTLSPTQLKK